MKHDFSRFHISGSFHLDCSVRSDRTLVDPCLRAVPYLYIKRTVIQIYRLVFLFGIQKMKFDRLFSTGIVVSIRRLIQLVGRFDRLRRDRDLQLRLDIRFIALIAQHQIARNHRFSLLILGAVKHARTLLRNNPYIRVYLKVLGKELCILIRSERLQRI